VTFTVRFVSSAADIPDALWDACIPPPLEGRWWYRALETCGLEDQFTFLYGVILDGDRPVGIAPAFIGTSPIALAVPPALARFVAFGSKFLPALLGPRTLFVGSPCSDEGTVGLLPGADRRAALEAVQQALAVEQRRRNLHMTAWKDFPEADAEDLGWLAARYGLFRMTSFPATVATLTGGRKDTYLAALKGSRRGQLRKKMRISAGQLDVDVETVQQPPAAVLDEIFGLFLQTYERAKTRFERLNRRFFEIIAKTPAAYFVLIRHRSSRDMLAFMLCYDTGGGRVVNKFIGLDYARPRAWYLYFRLWDAAVDWALARGATEIHSGQTGYRAKIDTGHRLLPLTNYGRHRNKLIHWLFSTVVRTTSWETLDPDLAVFVKSRRPDAKFGVQSPVKAVE
jgi:hypothetical protein